MDHVADVEKVTLCPAAYRAVCRCGSWDETGSSLEELQIQFSDHRRDEYERQRLAEEIR